MKKVILNDKLEFIGNEEYHGEDQTGEDLDESPYPPAVKTPTIPTQKERPSYKPVIEKPVLEEYTGIIGAIYHTDNEIAGAANKLVVNTANTLTTVFQYTIPQGRKFHFKSQKENKLDRNIVSYLLKICSDSTGTFLTGTYRILAWNNNQTKTKAILASGSLSKFGIGIIQYADLVDVQKRAWYLQEVWLTERDVIQVQILSPTVLDPDYSLLVMEYAEYVP